MAAQRGIFHKLEQTGFSYFVFVEYIKELEYESQVLFFTLISKLLNCLIVVCNQNSVLETIHESRRQYYSYLICNRVLVTLFQI